MPQHQPPHDHTGPPNTPPTAFDKFKETNEDTEVASSAVVAPRAFSATPLTLTKSKASVSPPASHLKTTSLLSTPRPPRISSLLPPPRVLQKLPFEGDESTGGAETPSSADRYWHQHTAGATTNKDPHDLHTFSNQDRPWNTHHPKHSQLHQRPAQTSHDRFVNADTQCPAQPLDESFRSREVEAGFGTQRVHQQSQPVSGAPSVVPDKLLTSTAGRPRTGSLPPEQCRHQMSQDLSRDGQSARGHGRRRSSKGSTDADKGKGTKPPSQKAMLSRALQKANTAVQLDNAQNLEGARSAYAEACDLLQQVLRRTSGDEDKRKLEAIVSRFHITNEIS